MMLFYSADCSWIISHIYTWYVYFCRLHHITYSTHVYMRICSTPCVRKMVALLTCHRPKVMMPGKFILMTQLRR